MADRPITELEARRKAFDLITMMPEDPAVALLVLDYARSLIETHLIPVAREGTGAARVNLRVVPATNFDCLRTPPAHSA